MRTLDGLARRQIYKVILKDFCREYTDNKSCIECFGWDSDDTNLRLTRLASEAAYCIVFYEDEVILQKAIGNMYFEKMLSITDTPEDTFKAICLAIEADIL